MSCSKLELVAKTFNKNQNTLNNIIKAIFTEDEQVGIKECTDGYEIYAIKDNENDYSDYEYINVESEKAVPLIVSVIDDIIDDNLLQEMLNLITAKQSNLEVISSDGKVRLKLLFNDTIDDIFNRKDNLEEISKGILNKDSFQL